MVGGEFMLFYSTRLSGVNRLAIAGARLKP